MIAQALEWMGDNWIVPSFKRFDMTLERLGHRNDEHLTSPGGG
jgi:hypothetical protein